jgi:hypothetical protein
MTDQPTAPQGGRPAIGPAISVAYQQDLLDAIDHNAAREDMSRAQWLRRAAARSLPPKALTPSTGIPKALAELDEDLQWTRDAARDYDAPANERIADATRYSKLASQMGQLIREARKTIPLQEAAQAYRQAEKVEPEDSTVLAEAWARTTATARLDRLLEELSAMLPTDAYLEPSRAALDDPLEID